MGKKIRITRKTLKKDEVRSYWLQLWAWALDNQKPLFIAVTAVAIVVVFGAAWRNRTAGRTATANSYLSSAQALLQQALFTTDEETRDKSFRRAEEQLRTIVELYGGTALAPQATFLLGNIAFFRHNYDEAVELYQEYIDRVKDPLDKADGYIAIGYCFENKFFWTQRESADRQLLDQALQNFFEAENMTTGTMQHYHAKLGRARLYDLQEGRLAQARQLYEQIVRERQLDPIEHSPDAMRGNYSWLIEQIDQMKRLFALAETAQLRLDRLEAGD